MTLWDWELSLMKNQHGVKPDTWGLFHFLCQLWQTATSTASEHISPRSLPSQTVLLFFKLSQQYVILSKLEINELSMIALKSDQVLAALLLECVHNVFCYERWWADFGWAFSGELAANFHQVSSCVCVLFGFFCPKTLQATLKLEIEEAMREENQPYL